MSVFRLEKRQIDFLDLFGGIGGFRLGLERASERFNCVGYYDNDKFAVKSYNAIFGENHETTNVKELEVDKIPEHDVLCAGFPCQSFSIAGERGGFEDTRGTLFFEIARVARGKLPTVLLLENVKGLLNHSNGETFEQILATLDELGYDAEWQVLNSKYHGVPQNRERVFIIAYLRGEPRPEVFPFREPSGGTLGENPRERGVTTKRGGGVSTRSISTAVDANYWKGIDNHGARTAIVDWRGRKDGEVAFRDYSPTLRSESHGHQPKVLDLTYGFDDLRLYGEYSPSVRSERHDLKIINHQMRPEDRPSIEDGQSGGSGILYNEDYSYALSGSPHFVQEAADERGKIRIHRDDEKSSEIQGYSTFLPDADYVDVIDRHDKNVVEPVMTPDFHSKGMNKKDRIGSEDGSMFTVDSTSVHGVKESTRIRKLTPLECWRLQGFPDWAYHRAQKVNSDTQLYKQAGNAVSVPVIEDIGERLARYFKQKRWKG